MEKIELNLENHVFLVTEQKINFSLQLTLKITATLKLWEDINFHW